jgi:hypothetical protein
LYSSAAATDGGDAGSQTISEVTITVTNVQDTTETLTVDGTGITLAASESGTTSTNSLSYAVSGCSNTCTIALTSGSMTMAQLQTMVDAITYSNSDQSPTHANDRVVTITTIKDSGGTANSGDDSAAVNRVSTVDLVAAADLPTTGDKTISATEDTVKMFASGDFTFADVDGDSISHVKITTLESAGTLFVDADNDDTYDSGEDVTLNQEIAIGSITNLGFVGASNANGNGYATFSFKVKDGTAYSSGAGENTINLAAANDLPTTGDKTISASEDVAKMFASGDFTYADVDSDSISHVKITTLESAGTLFVDADNDDTYDGRGCNSEPGDCDS